MSAHQPTQPPSTRQPPTPPTTQDWQPNRPHQADAGPSKRPRNASPTPFDVDGEVAEGLAWDAERRLRDSDGATAAATAAPISRPSRLADLAAEGDGAGLFGVPLGAPPPRPAPRVLANEVTGSTISVTSARGADGVAGRRVYCAMAGPTPGAADAAAREAALRDKGAGGARGPALRLLAEPIEVLLARAERRQLQVGGRRV